MSRPPLTNCRSRGHECPQWPQARRTRQNRQQTRQQLEQESARRIAVATLLCLWATALIFGVGVQAQVEPASVFLDGEAFDSRVEIEIVEFGDARAHRDALLGALEQINRSEALSDPDGTVTGGLGDLNRAAGKGPIAIDPRLPFVLERALGFCQWSGGAHGPLGGNLYRAWGLRQPAASRPRPEALRDYAELTRCDALVIDPESLQATLAEGARLDLWGFAQGWAVDRAVDALRERGATNGFVRLGTLSRAFGPGLEGKGWPAHANPTDREEIEERVLLRDQALAMASRLAGKIEIAGDSYSPYIHQTLGQPTGDKLAILTVSDLAIDAQGLAVSLFLVSEREGRFRLGGLQPPPAVLWMMGSGEGYPLIGQLRWSALAKW